MFKTSSQGRENENSAYFFAFPLYLFPRYLFAFPLPSEKRTQPIDGAHYMRKTKRDTAETPTVTHGLSYLLSDSQAKGANTETLDFHCYYRRAARSKLFQEGARGHPLGSSRAIAPHARARGAPQTCSACHRLACQTSRAGQRRLL